MWNNMLHNTVSSLELIVRSVLVYLFLLLILRLTGKRQVGQLAPFDLVLLLVLSNAVQNSMNGGDNSITGGMILAVTLIGLNWVAGYLTYRSKFFEGLIEGRPIVLIHNGHIDNRALKKCCLTHHELDAALRSEGHIGPENVHFALLENNGQITIVGKQ